MIAVPTLVGVALAGILLALGMVVICAGAIAVVSTFAAWVRERPARFPSAMARRASYRERRRMVANRADLRAALRRRS